MKLKYSLTFGILVLLASCVKDFSLPENQKGATLNSLFSPQDGLRVYLTESIPATGQSDQQTAITGATVKLFENDQFLENLVFIPSSYDSMYGYYKTTKHLHEGKRYRVSAETRQYGQLSAFDSIPSQVPLSGLVVKVDTSYGEASLYFTDNYASADFYRLNVYTRGKYKTVNTEGDTVIVAYNYTCRAQLLERMSDTVRDSRNLLFSDKGINGGAQALHFNFYLPDTAYMVSQSLYIELNHVSENHYNYFRKLALYRGSSYNAEPVHLFGNIEHGNGIFAGQSITRKVIVLK
ncbi:MAG: DUF4249 domain-containing protein [Chitinophagales bacterium]